MTARSALQRIAGAAIGLGLAIAATAPVSAAELLTNGDFETGTFAGWTVTTLPNSGGTWLIGTPGAPTPTSGAPTSAAGGAPHGTSYAVTDQVSPGTYVLSQSFAWAGGSSLTLMFDMFANDWDGGPIVDPAGLTHFAGPNQHVRVDILSAAASVFDTGAGVVTSLIAPTVDPQASNPNPFTPYVFDLSGLAAGTYQLRFGAVDTEFFLHMGVDNVSLQAVPEPASLALLGLGLAGLAATRKRRP